MAYVIAEPCIGTKDTACVDACPVDCIHPKKDEADHAEAEQLFIDPVECIDCGGYHPEATQGTWRDRETGFYAGCPGPVVGRTEHGSPIAPADQLVGAIGELHWTAKARPLHLIRAGASLLARTAIDIAYGCSCRLCTTCNATCNGGR